MIGDTIRAHASGPLDDADRLASILLAVIVLTAWLLALLFGAG
mgnify:CR=1 FL=1